MKRRLLPAWILLLSTAAWAQEPPRISVADTQAMPWERAALRLSRDWVMKVLEDNPVHGHRVALAYLPPGRVSHEKRHYHRFRQWFYILHGDIPVFDYTSAEEKRARVNILREGYFLDRPIASMHGEEGNPRAQGGTLFLMWLGGSMPIVEVPLEGPYPEDVQFQDDRIIDTRAMDWFREADGTLTKGLAPDVRLLLLPPGWKGASAPPSLRSAFVIYGDGTLEAGGSKFNLREGSYIRQPAGELAKTEAGEIGCMLLEWYEASLPPPKR